MSRHPAPTAQHEKLILALGLLAFCIGVIVLMLALVLGFHIENSDRAIANSAKGRLIAVPAALAVIAAVVCLSGRRRGWARAVAGVGAAAAVLAGCLAVLIPGG